jgi:hypothetical protein
MILTIGKTIALASAVAGAIGTLLIYRGSFAFESPGFIVDDELMKKINARNRRRHILQRLGLGLLMISFVLAGISVVLD